MTAAERHVMANHAAAQSMTVEPMTYHGPGWSIDTDTGDYWLWAPRSDRPRWAACWDRNDSTQGDFRRADTAEAAVACFPGDAEGRRARAALLAASRSEEETGR